MSARRWPASTIEHWPLDMLVPCARNARSHSDAQVAQLAASMKRFGWATAVLVDESREIIAGHGRVLAAQTLFASGLQEFSEAPVMTAVGWTPDEKLAYQIADNKLALNAEWNMAQLAEGLLELDAHNFETGLLGFSEAELSNILAPVGSINRDDEWRGMPEYQQEDQMAFRSIKVHFRNQADVDAFAALMQQSITEKTKYIWHPADEIEWVTDKRVLGDES